MRIKNAYNLPQPFVDAVSVDDYDKGDSDYTSTGVLQPPRMSVLTKKHWDEMEEDVIDRLPRFAGQVKHVVLQRMAQKNPDRYIVETRFYAKVIDFLFSGQIDLYDKQDCILYDWKEASVWKAIVGDQKEWHAQGNMNRYLLTHQCVNYPVTKVIFIAFFKDWKRREAARDRDYPQQPVQTFEIPLWTNEQTFDFIAERIRLHESAKIELPECTDEERWAKPTQWAVRKRVNKRATYVCDTLEEAEQRRGDNINMVIEERKGEDTRCLHHCSAYPFCEQAQKYKQSAQEPEPEPAMADERMFHH